MSRMRAVGGVLVSWIACGGVLGCAGPATGAASGEGGSHAEGGLESGCTASDASSDAQGVSVAVEGGTLYGTFVPASCEATAEALIVAGSGPTDRNGNDPPTLDTNAYEELASSMAQVGTSSIRYDKRGVGQSAAAGPIEMDLTFDMYVDDARAWVRSMRAAGASRIVLFGHSEGSLIGILVSEVEPVDALVSLEGAGRPAGEVLRSQLQAQLTSAEFSQASSIIDQLEAGQAVANVPSNLASVLGPAVQPYLISWFRYDPAAEIAKLTVPVLIVQGTADLQTTTQDAALLTAAAKHGTRALVAGMTHTLKLATASDPEQTAAYTDPSLPLAPGLVSVLDAFLAPEQ